MKIVKNKKAFTLVELLAVIVILGILLTLIIPNVTKYINTAKKEAYVASVLSIAKAIESEKIPTIIKKKMHLNLKKNMNTIMIKRQKVEKNIQK